MWWRVRFVWIGGGGESRYWVELSIEDEKVEGVFRVLLQIDSEL